MAVTFLTDGIGQAVTRCWLDGRDVSSLATRVYIPAIEKRTDMPPAVGWLECSGSIDLHDIDAAGRIIPDVDGNPTTTRYYGMIKLVWRDA